MVDVVDVSHGHCFDPIWAGVLGGLILLVTVFMHDNSVRHVVKNIPLLLQQAFDLFELQKVNFGVLLYEVANIVYVKDVTRDVSQVVT